MQDPDTLTTREAARRLGVSLRTVQLWTESGALDAWKTPGGHRRVLLAAVDRMIALRQPPASRETERALRVLVVEDDPTLLHLYRTQLTALSMPVDLRIATNGYEGLIRIGEQVPDVLITDLMMPGIDGFGMLRTLRGRPGLESMDVLVVTGLTPGDIALEGGLPGDITVLSKPVPFAAIEQRLALKLATIEDAR